MLLKIKSLLLLILLSDLCFGQIPILNSRPAITNKVIYLDFDGQYVVGTGWNSGSAITALPSTMNAANIVLIFKRVAEDYIPFDVNITTDSVRFNNAPPISRTRVVVTPTSAWYGSAGGVAYIGSFSWGGTPGTPCWVFENMLGYSAKNIAEAASHEAGHTLTLRHQSTYSAATCSKTAEYNPGQGTGVNSWAPIMGVGYYKNVTTWYNGLSSSSCTLIQNDHSNSGIGLTSPGYLNFIPDDVGNTFAAAKTLTLNNVNLADSGLITQPSDVDAYKFTICNNRYISIDVKPWALDTTGYQGANLDVKLFLYNVVGAQLAVDSSLLNLNARIGIGLPPGTYWFTIDGGGSPNYSDYGSMGRYYIKLKATNPPTMDNAIIAPPSVCEGQPVSLNYISNGTPTQWLWTVSGSAVSNTYAVQNPNISYSAGIYTVSLLASSSASISCATTATLTVLALPQIAINASASYVCAGNSTTLSVSGASSYTWQPGFFNGLSQTLTPLATSNYTVYGSNGACSNSAVATISVNPAFTVTVAASAASICVGQPVTLTAGGAPAFTINPGGLTANPATISPASSTSFVVTGESGGCLKTASVAVNVSQHFAVGVLASDSALCVGDTVALSASGASNYTFNPGGLSGNMVTVSPAATTIYTLTGQAAGNVCIEDTIITIVLKDCYVGIRQETKNSEGMRIFPNPSHGSFVIDAGTSDKKIEILDAVGQVIASLQISGKPVTINTGSWASGIYVVKLSSGLSLLDVQKIVIE